MVGSCLFCAKEAGYSRPVNRRYIKKKEKYIIRGEIRTHAAHSSRWRLITEDSDED